MSRWFLLPLALAVFALVQSSDAADDKDDPKKAPPAIAELLKSRPEEFIKRHDKNKDGYLTKDELPPALARIFDRLDTNGDGKLDKDEVAAMFKMLRQRFERTEQAPPDLFSGEPGVHPGCERRMIPQRPLGGTAV